MNYRSVAQHALTFILVLSMSACGSGSGAATVELANAAISLTITSPISAPAIETPDTAMSFAGNAGSDVGISSVSWENDRGGDGVANGTESWQIASIDLELGENKITVTAVDTSGATTSRSIVVKRESGGPGSVTLSWTAPTARTDGSPLANLAGYKIFYGRMSGIYDYQIGINNPGISTYVVENLVSGDWYFALAAYDSQGLESERSNEVLREII